MSTIAERDWKIFSKLAVRALDRHCAQTLQGLRTIIDSEGPTNHQKYLQVFKYVDERNEEMVRAFDDRRRSNADVQLLAICSMKLLTAEEMAEFGDETRERVQYWLNR